MEKPRILLVDDDALFLLAHREELKAAGYEPRTARDGREALEIAGNEEIAIAFVDLIMPRLGGIETCRGLRRVSPGTEVVLLTGFPAQLSPPLRAFLEEEGGPGKLSKPLGEDELTRTIEKILKEKEDD
ncbi:MAG: response regulator [Candidatus Erginobacter occultus]|nr:response regulator [Candidatus Erginobacter occultus]